MNNTEFTFLIPAAGIGLKPNCELPTLLSKLPNGKCIFEQQIENIRETFPLSRIIFITGFGSQFIDTSLCWRACDIFHNFQYEKTTIASSLANAMNSFSIHEKCFILYGNTVFQDDIFAQFRPYRPKGNRLGVYKSSDKKNIGVGPNGEFDYIFEDKWAKVLYLENTKPFVANSLDKPWLLTHEVLKNCGHFELSDLSNQIVQIKRTRDLKQVQSLLL